MSTPGELRIVTALREMEFFRDMDHSHLHKLAAIAREVRIDKGEIIYRQGEAGKGIYLIETGQVVIETDIAGYGLAPLLTVGPGQLFGWSSLFPGRRKQAQARALETTQAIFIDGNQFQDLLHSDHNLERSVNLRLTELIAERVSASRQQLVRALTGR
jgi:CRP/FNR family transcriptional regulator, cyclic AMP receptor protein